MNHLPAIPAPGVSISLNDVVALESSIAQQITTIEDVDALEEMRAKADALARYLHGKELHGPMLGAQRRIEARLGQLLGNASQAQRNGGPLPTAVKVIPPNNRVEFRLLARGFGVLTDEEWRQTRKNLLAHLREKYPVPKHQPAVVVTKSGSVKKLLEVRVKEIATLAESGHRAAQIGEKLGLDEKRVRHLARKGGVRLVDDDLGKPRRVDPVRVLRETITGIEAYADGLSILDSVDLPTFEAREQAELLQSLSRSINALRKLHNKMRSTYDRPQGSDTATA